MERRKRFLIFVLVLFGLTSSNVFAKAKKKIVRVVTANSLTLREMNTLAVAKKNGYLEQELEKIGWEVEYNITKGGVALNEGLYAKEYDIGFIGDVPGVTGLYNEIGSIWIGSGLSNSDQSIAVTKNSKIKKPEDLYGKTLALFIGTAPHYTWAKYSERYNLDTSKINIVNLNGADTLVAIETGKVDAAIQLSSSLLKMQKDGKVDILFDTKEEPLWSGQSMIVARKEFTKKNPEVAIALIKALFRAKQEIKRSPKEYYDLISGSQIYGDIELGESIFNIDNGKFENFDPGLTDLSIQKAQGLVDVFVKIGRFPERKDISKYVDLTFYNQAVKQLKEEGFDFE